MFHGKQLEWKVKRLKFCQKLKNPEIKLIELIELGKVSGQNLIKILLKLRSSFFSIHITLQASLNAA